MDLGIVGKWALVCGASKGLGYACAEALAREGVNVLIAARGAPALEEAAERLKKLGAGQVLAVACDVTTEQGRSAILAARDSFDILITNAGGPPPGDFRNWQREDWIKALDANMLTPIALIQRLVDGMAERGFGRIVNITSGAVKSPQNHLGLSNGARSGLTGFVAGLARSAIAGRNVTINNLMPGAFDTDRLQATLAGAARQSGGTVQAAADARRNSVPAGRFGDPAEFGQFCAFLCSVQAGYINGQNLMIDGGAFPGTF